MIDVNKSIEQAYDESTTQVDKIIVDEKEYRITNVQFYDDCYDEGNIFGTAIARALEFEIENTINLEKKEFEYCSGIFIKGSVQWISLGNFITQDIEPNDTTNTTKVTAIDYMIKTNIPYKTRLPYQNGKTTLLQVLQEVCSNSELILATTNFANNNFIVDSNQFSEGTLNRQVIQAVAQISGTVAKIKNNNHLYLINPNKVTTISKVFTLNNYKEAEIKRTTHPINLVSLGMKDIEGENVVFRDEESIAKDGENSLVINDNPFAYTQAKREQLITALFNAVKGFEYSSYKFDCQAVTYLETMDKIQFLDKKGNIYNSFIFRFNYKSPNGLESTIEAPSVTRATINYQNVLSALEIAKRTEIIVDKQNQTITQVVSKVEEQNQKVSEVTQTVDELRSHVSEIADITISADGNGSVYLANINESEPVRIEIRPRGEDIAYLHPRNDLFPSNTLFMPNRKVRFATKDYSIEWEIPANLLWYDAEHYDELILDYEGQSCIVNKKVGYNEDGTKYLLGKTKTLTFAYPKIPLLEGDYTITVLGYPNAYLFVRLMCQNIYTDQFATKAEMNSTVTQTAEKIESEVNKTLTNYVTTVQMNSVIEQKANSILSKVSETYATKTSLDNYSTTIQMNSAIEQKASSITSTVSTQISTAKTEAINSANTNTDNKLKNYSTTTQMNSTITQTANSILGTVSVNYATKASLELKVDKNKLISEINASADKISLEAGRLVITSGNFKLDEKGNITAINANVTGTITATTGKIGNFSIKNGWLNVKNGDVVTEVSDKGFNIWNEYSIGGGTLRTEIVSISFDGSNTYVNFGGVSGGTGTLKVDKVIAETYAQSSTENVKKNIVKFNKNAAEIIKNSDIYEYNYKREKDTDKKHIGFVIGNNYKTATEVVTSDKEGIDTYAQGSILWKFAQETIEKIENLQHRVAVLEGSEV